MSPLTEEDFRRAWQAGDELIPRPEFMPRAVFKRLVEEAARRDLPPEAMLGPGPLLVHPEALDWLLWRGPQGRLCSHFTAALADDDES